MLQPVTHASLLLSCAVLLLLCSPMWLPPEVQRAAGERYAAEPEALHSLVSRGQVPEADQQMLIGVLQRYLLDKQQRAALTQELLPAVLVSSSACVCVSVGAVGVGLHSSGSAAHPHQTGCALCLRVGAAHCCRCCFCAGVTACSCCPRRGRRQARRRCSALAFLWQGPAAAAATGQGAAWQEQRPQARGGQQGSSSSRSRTAAVGGLPQRARVISHWAACGAWPPGG